MGQFLVKMADERGRVLEQVESAHSAGELRERFAQQGFYVYSVKPRGLLSPAGGLRRISLERFLVFNQQFVTLIRAGLPITTTLGLLIRQQRDPAFRRLLEDVEARVRSGELLSSAFAAQGVLPRIYTTTLMAGEKSGNLEEVLNRYVAFQRMVLAFRKKLLVALIYPAILVAAVVGVLLFLVTYVVPEFAELYRALEAELPAITQVMLTIGVHVRAYLPIVVIALALAGLFLWRWGRTGRGAETLDRLRLRLPLLGDIWLKYQVATFARTLATLLSGGIPLVSALETAGASMRSRLIATSVMQAAQRVREGMPLSRSLALGGVFPELPVEMIEVGESTGALPTMLTSTAEFYEDDVQNALTAAMALIEPVIIIFMAVVVGLVLLSLYVPIFTLYGGRAVPPAL
jgi:type IV pilus assembly protein PilC